MLTRTLALAAGFALGPVIPALAQSRITGVPAQSTAAAEIPFERFVLSNGLTVIVHEDRSAPTVAVGVWYRVGSGDEPEGKSGFAHLFEHLLFTGSANYDKDYLPVLDGIGAKNRGGSTWFDETRYHATIATSALDLALWLESDRMGHFLPALTQEKLDREREVVKNERRQNYENQPYGKVRLLTPEATYPNGHPYAHAGIGSMQDLEQASLEDVKEWFRRYYTPNNAFLVLAGDIDVATARQKAEYYFGDIPPGPMLDRTQRWIAPLAGEQRRVMQDRVPQARVYKVWNVPEWGSAEAEHLNLLAWILGSGERSRLHQRLVSRDQLATEVSASMEMRGLGSQLTIYASAREGADLSGVERALGAELRRLIQEGPTAEEVRGAQAQHLAQFVRDIQSLGVERNAGKAAVLAYGELYQSDPGYYRTRLRTVRSATAEDLRRSAQKWLSAGSLVLEVRPSPKLAAGSSDADRSKLPGVATPSAAALPKLHRFTLSNGLQVVLAERHSVPLVQMDLMVDVGAASDPHAPRGTAALVVDMLNEGSRRRTAAQFKWETEQLGATITGKADLDRLVVSLTAIKEHLNASVDLLADLALKPTFPLAELESRRQQHLETVRNEQVTPVWMAVRALPRLLYHEGHPYAITLEGGSAADRASLTRITQADLAAFHRRWFRPNNATLIVAGSITPSEARLLLERHFGTWERAEVPMVRPPREQTAPPTPRVYLVDAPGTSQSIIFAAHPVAPKANPDEAAIQVMNTVLGATFSSRLNRNLRLEKGWSYVARSFIRDAEGPRVFFAYATVQGNRTSESMVEITKELRGIVGERPVTREELDWAKRNRAFSQSAGWSTVASLGQAVGDHVRYGYADDHPLTFAQQMQGLSVEEVNRVARNTIHPDRLVWVVVGDRSKIEAQVRSLGLGEVRVVDSDGRAVEPRGS